MLTVGIDIGGRRHAVARCREGEAKADREILWVTEDRAGFDRLDAWLDRQPEPVGLVAMESSGHYWMALAAHLRDRRVAVRVVNPLAAKYFARATSDVPSPTRPMQGASP
jgi:transposase